MPRRRRPLPERLLQSPFSVAEAKSLGVPAHRLESQDLVSLGHRLYAHVDLELQWPSGPDAPGHKLGPSALMALCRQHPGSVASHATAAHVFSLPVPDAVRDEPKVHLTWFDGSAATRLRGVVSHRSPLQASDRATFRRIPLTRPARTWLDLAGDTRLDEVDLVVLADAIVNRPWNQGERVDGMDTLAGLSAAVERAGSVKGIRRARVALGRTRVGADSPPETRTRLALVDAGLPEPGVQIRADPGEIRSPTADLGYRDLKIAIQYDGEHHRTAQQQTADVYRDEWFRSLGWKVIRLTWLDQQQGFTRLIGLVRECLARSIVPGAA